MVIDQVEGFAISESASDEHDRRLARGRSIHEPALLGLPGPPSACVSRRARLRPEDVGLPSFGRRRVPGLRRQELAQLAGVSVDHYVRLEQARASFLMFPFCVRDVSLDQTTPSTGDRVTPARSFHPRLVE